MIQQQRMEQQVTIVKEVSGGCMAGGLQHHLVVREGKVREQFEKPGGDV